MAKAYPANHKKPWTDQEIKDLIWRSKQGFVIDFIMLMHGRTAGAILSKLVELRILRPNRHKQAFTLNGEVYCTYEERKRLMP
jgi:hypothetical protein